MFRLCEKRTNKMASVSENVSDSSLSEPCELAIVSSSNKLPLQNIAAFGDAEDIFYENVIESSGGTIIFTIDVRRKFMPGNYVMHVVGPDMSLGKDHSYVSAILCREDVDPKLIHELLINSNCDRNAKNPHLTKNFISRYDWMHYRNWGEPVDDSDNSMNSKEDTDTDESDESLSSEDEKQNISRKFKQRLHEYFQDEPRHLVFFVNGSNVNKDIVYGTYDFVRENESIVVIKSTIEAEAVIGFIIQENSKHSFVAGDWNYGCLLTDKTSAENFAFIFGDLYLMVYIDRYRPSGEKPIVKYDIQKDEFTYDIKNFLYQK